MIYGLNHHNANLNHEPIPFYPFNSSADWHTFGDLHGNALYLLYFLLRHGLARFTPQAFPSDDDISLLGIKNLTPRTYYELFRKIYDKPLDFWTQENIVLVYRSVEHLEISDSAHIRLLGDIFCDRGENDYFTWKVLEKIFQNKNATLEIILSNHDMEFINRHEMGGDDPYSEMNAFCMKNTQYKQTQSLLNMSALLNRGLISYKKIGKHYAQCKTKLKLLSYDHYPDGKLVIYSHAPINEIDILRAALCLVDKANSEMMGNWLSKEDLAYLQKIQAYHPSYVYDEKLTNDDLLKFIDILNRFTSYMASQDRLTELMTMTLSEHPDSFFGEGYGHRLPFEVLIWSKSDPNKRKLNTMVQSVCSFTNTHGHTDGKFQSCHCLDGNFGRPNHHKGFYPVHISRSPLSLDYIPPPRNYALIATGAVLFLGIVSLIIARVCTGEIGAIFALGSFKIAGEAIKGLPHLGVIFASVATYFLMKPASLRDTPKQSSILEDGLLRRSTSSQ